VVANAVALHVDFIAGLGVSGHGAAAHYARRRHLVHFHLFLPDF
jgi:hypothetical protein